MRHRLAPYLVLLGLAIPSLANATAWTAGLLALQRDTAYRGMDRDALVVPFVQAEGERFWWRGLAAGMTVHRDEQWRVDTLVQARMDGFDADDSAYFAGMADRRRSLDIGLQVQRQTALGQWRIALLGDALQRHRGNELQLGWQTDWRQGPLLIQPGVSASWQSGSLVNYYFGVATNEARFDRPAYRATGGWRAEASLSALLPLSARWALFGRIGAQRLPASAANSPLVDSRIERGLLLGIGYRWGNESR